MSIMTPEGRVGQYPWVYLDHHTLYTFHTCHVRPAVKHPRWEGQLEWEEQQRNDACMRERERDRQTDRQTDRQRKDERERER